MALQPGQQFGRYELMFRLGHGSITETWRARRLEEDGSSRPVLFQKVLPEYAQDPLFTPRFLNEARTSATLTHANIAQVYDFGQRGDEYFLAREYVDGQPLQALLQRAVESGLHALPAPLAVFIAREMCRGLHYAHTRTDERGMPLGIVHGGLSLDQVLVSYDGQVKIVDFGIARAREQLGARLDPGGAEDRRLLIAPEQTRGGKAWDARADVWATGAILFAMLRGKPPLPGELPWPDSVDPGLPEGLAPIILQAVALHREERYGSCEELDQALTGFLDSTAPGFSALTLAHFVQELFREDLDIEGRAVPKSPPPPTEKRRSRAMTGSLVGLAGFALVAVITIVRTLVSPGARPHPGPTNEWEFAHVPGQPIDVDAAESSPPPSNVRTLSLPARTAYKNAYVAFHKKDYDMALTWTLECIKLEPSNGDCLLLAGDTYTELDQVSPAVERYNKFLEVAPQHAAAGRVRRFLSTYQEEQAERARRKPAEPQQLQRLINH